jgi:hypothetical protein
MHERLHFSPTQTDFPDLLNRTRFYPGIWQGGASVAMFETGGCCAPYGRFRRILVVAARSGGGPFII